MPEIVIPCPTWKEVKPWLYRLLVLGIALYLAYLVREIWLPLLLAFLIALILDPVVDRMEARGFSRTAGAALIFGGFLLVVGGIVYLGAPVIIDQGEQLQTRVSQAIPDSSPEGIDAMLEEEGVPPRVRALMKAAFANAQASISRSSSLLTSRMIEYASNLIWVVIVPIVAFHALRDFHVILGKGLLLVSPRRRDFVQAAVSEVTAVFARYMRGLAVISGLNAVATWLVLWVLGVPSALVLGIVAGILSSVPYLGALITMVLVSAVAFLSGGLNYMLLVLAVLIVLQEVIFDNMITPRILGKHVGLHPILAIIALLAGNALLGLLGMVLAVPIAACIQIGILALVPKLRKEIDVAQEQESAERGEASKAQQLKTDATQSLHRSVGEAVESIEKSVPEEERRRTKVMKRRRSRVADSGC